jgi:Secretion system C-terminal sorting domain
MKKLTLALLLSYSVFAQYADPNFDKPASGYGADGAHTVAVESFENPNFANHDIKIYHPQDITTPVPTIFYSHAYGGTDPDNIIGVLEFIAKKGYAVVFIPYQTLATVTVPERYANLIAGFRKAATDYPEIIDTTKAGFLGHSFGGAASFGISHELFAVDGWGANGRFVYALAQWYAYNLEPDDLTSFPSNTKVLVEILDNDESNDHRMAIDIFNHITVAAAEKDFLLVPSSTVNGYTYSAEHNMPNTAAAFDALDYYAYYRLLDALIDYSFNGNTAGKDVALGHGSTAQVSMPGDMANLVSYTNPTPAYPQSQYSFPCSSDENPRQDFCETTTGINTFTKPEVTLYPNPSTNTITIEDQNSTGIYIKLYNNLGQQLGTYRSVQNNFTINTFSLQPGVYFVEVNGVSHKFIKA